MPSLFSNAHDEDDITTFHPPQLNASHVVTNIIAPRRHTHTRRPLLDNPIIEEPTDTRCEEGERSNPNAPSNTVRLSALSNYQVLIRRIRDRYSSSTADIPNSQVLSDVKEVCELALDLNQAVASMSEDLEQMTHVRNDLEETGYELEMKLRDANTRHEEAITGWKSKYEHLLEELDKKDEQLFELQEDRPTAGHMRQESDKPKQSTVVLERQVFDLQSELAQLDADHQAQQHRTRQLREEHSQEIAHFERMVANLEAESESLTSKLNEALRNNDDTHSALTGAESRYEALERKYQDVVRRQDEMIQHLMSLTTIENRAVTGTPLEADAMPSGLSLEAAVQALIDQHKRRQTLILGTQIAQPLHIEKNFNDDVSPQPHEEPVEVVREVPIIREIEVVREVPVEIIKEVIRQVPVEVVKEVQVVREVPYEVVKEVVREVPVEVVREVPVEVIKEVIREVPMPRPPLESPMISLADLRNELQKAAGADLHVHFHQHGHDHAHSHSHAHNHFHQYNVPVEAVTPPPQETRALSMGMGMEQLKLRHKRVY